MFLSLMHAHRWKPLITFGAVWWVMSIRTVKYRDMGLVKPIAIIGFPSTGLVSSILSNFYVSQYKMEVIGGMSGPEMPPYCFLYNGSAYPPVRMYGHKGKGKKGRDVIVCVSEYAPKPEQCYVFAHEMIRYLRSMDVTDVICLEGINRFSDHDEPLVCGSGPGAMDLMKKSKLDKMDNGMIRGMTGVLLYDGPLAGLNVVSIMTEGNPNIPDPGAAAKLLEPMSKMVPGLKLDPSPLLKEAEEIERHIDNQEQEERLDDSALYG